MRICVKAHSDGDTLRIWPRGRCDGSNGDRDYAPVANRNDLARPDVRPGFGREWHAGNEDDVLGRCFDRYTRGLEVGLAPTASPLKEDQTGRFDLSPLKVLPAVPVGEQYVATRIQEVGRAEPPKLSRECRNGGKSERQRRNDAGLSPDVSQPLEKLTKCAFGIRFPDRREPVWPEGKPFSYFGQPTSMGEGMHPPRQFAGEGLRVPIDAFTLSPTGSAPLIRCTSPPSQYATPHPSRIDVGAATRVSRPSRTPSPAARWRKPRSS